jgi:hypothetical protein
MLPWLLVAALTTLLGLVITGGLQVRRYSRGHVAAQLAVRGRGLYISRTPDGTWWRVRLRPRCGACAWPSDWGDEPPDRGVREPRRPLPSGALGGVPEPDEQRRAA